MESDSRRQQRILQILTTAGRPMHITTDLGPAVGMPATPSGTRLLINSVRILEAHGRVNVTTHPRPGGGEPLLYVGVHHDKPSETELSQSSTRRRKRSSKRLHKLRAERKETPHPALVDFSQRLVKLTNLLESIPPDDYDWSDPLMAQMVLEDLTEHQVWIDVWLAAANAAVSDADAVEVIRRLRADTAGRTPAEITAAHRLAERLEARRTRELGEE